MGGRDHKVYEYGTLHRPVLTLRYGIKGTVCRSFATSLRKISYLISKYVLSITSYGHCQILLVVNNLFVA